MPCTGWNLNAMYGLTCVALIARRRDEPEWYDLDVRVPEYHVRPEQTPPGRARRQFEDQARSNPDDRATAFSEAGGDAETRLVFTHDPEQTLVRGAGETGCEPILVPNPAPDNGRLLVPLSGEVNVVRLTAFVAALMGDRDIAVRSG